MQHYCCNDDEPVDVEVAFESDADSKQTDALVVDSDDVEAAAADVVDSKKMKKRERHWKRDAKQVETSLHLLDSRQRVSSCLLLEEEDEETDADASSSEMQKMILERKESDAVVADADDDDDSAVHGRRTMTWKREEEGEELIP